MTSHPTAVTLLILALALTPVLAQENAAPPNKADTEAKGDAQIAPPKGKAPSKPARPVKPKPPSELDQLKFMQGRFTCDGTIHASPLGPERVVQASLSSRRDIEGFWVVTSYVERGGKDNPLPLRRDTWMTFDPVARSWKGAWFDNGGGIGAAASEGFVGDKMVWTGDYSRDGKTLRVRHTLAKKSDAELTLTGEVSPDGSSWSVLSELTCAKPQR